MWEWHDEIPPDVIGMEQLSETIQVGGARYALGGRSYPGFKGRKHFQQDFDALPDTERLFRTYFDVDPLSERQSMLPRFQRDMDPLSEKKSKKKTITKIANNQDSILLNNKLRKRLQKMQHTNEFTSMDVKNRKLQNDMIQMKHLMESLREPQQESLATLPESMHDISENDKLEFIIKVAWILLHIDRAPEDIQEKWKEIRKQTEDLSLSDLVTHMNDMSPPQESLNYFKNMEENESPLPPNEMEHHIQNLLDILHIKKYLSTHSKGTNRLSHPLQNAMGSVIRRFKGIFDPLYTVLEKGIPSSLENTFPSLLLTLHLCDILRDKPKGLYRITDVPPALLTFVTAQLDAVQNYISKRSKKQQEEFHRQVYALSTQSFKNENNPIIQLYVKDHNIRLLIDQEPISSFFMDGNHLYLLSTTYHNIQEKNTPLELRSIEYDSLHLDDAVFYETDYQTKRNETVEDVFILDTLFGEQSILPRSQRGMDQKMAYTSTELAMSMLIAFDNLTSNQNESANWIPFHIYPSSSPFKSQIQLL